MAIRRANNLYQERLVMSFEQPSTAATLTVKLWGIPTGRVFRVDGVWYDNPTGLASSDTNYFVLALKDGSTTIASWSTKTTGGNGALVADTPVQLALSGTDSNLVLASGDVMSFAMTLTGTATLPAGRLVIYGRLD